jgi:glycosyltransferase involved in cell wall biosynthesis
VVVPHRDDLASLRGTLDALRAQTRPPDSVCVVDDASSDATPEVVPVEYPEVRYVRLEHNAGFGAACNTGVRTSTADVVLLLNNDTVADARFVEEVMAVREATGAAMVAACLRKRDGTVDSFGIEVDRSLVAFDALHGEPYDPARAARRTPLAPCAGAGAYERGAFLRAGGFDEAMFAYLEDVDLGLRLALAGEHCAVAPCAFAWHLHSAYWGSGTARKNERMGDSRGHIVWKYRSGLSRRARARGWVIDLVVYAGQVAIDRNAGALRGRWRGWRRRRALGPSGVPAHALGQLPYVEVTLREALARRLARRRPRRAGAPA